MAFHLIMRKDKEDCFDIVTNEELNNMSNSQLFTEIECGDKTKLEAMIKQLGGKPFVHADTHGDIEMSSPVMKITRVVAVTSSGNTKYSISPTISDPYHTDSDQEYVPTGEPESSSSSEESEVFTRGDICRVQDIKRKINFDDKPSHVEPSTSKHVHSREVLYEDECAERISNRASPSTSTTLTVDTGEVTIIDTQIIVETYAVTHHGKFSLNLEEVSSWKPGRCVLKANLPFHETEHDHKCRSVDPRKPIAYALLYPDKNSVIITFEFCMLKGSAVGTLIFIEETNTYTSFLKFYDAFMDEEPEEIPIVKSNERKLKMKQHYCKFCKKLKTCIGRHYKQRHHKELQVKEIIDAALLPETQAKAHILMRNLRLEGDRIYNESVSLYDRIPVRKHRIQMIHTSVHCPSCSALIAAKNFYKHHRNCTGRAPDKIRRLRFLQTEERLKRCTMEDNDKLFVFVVGNMTNDNLREIIENDPLAKSFAVQLARQRPKNHNINNIRQQLRRIARLFVEVQKRKPEVKQLADMFIPSMYSTMMACIRDMCCFNEPHVTRKNQLALSYGPIITSLITRLRLDLMKNSISKNDRRFQDLDNLKTIHEEEFKVEVTRNALVSAKEKRMLKKSELPSTRDIQKLVEYARKMGDRLYNQLKNSFDVDTWIDLGRSLLCQLLVFNRRRVGEMSRARVQDFNNRKKVTPEYFSTLNRLEIILAEEFSIFTIMAKRTRPVNLLVTKSQVQQLELLISLRERAGIPKDNEYLFASPTRAIGYLEASDVLRYFAGECGASNPSLLKSTNLRKHVATISQIFCLNDNEMKQLADFLGHDRNVHEQFYRLNECNTQITKLSKFLCTVGDGNVFQYKGKTIDELPFEVINDGGSNEIGDDDEFDESSGEEEGAEMTEQTESPLPVVQPTAKVKKVPPKAYTLRRRFVLKLPAKLLSPAKELQVQAQSAVKSPLTTGQLLNVLASPKRKPTKKLRWSPKEKAIMQREFAANLRDNTLPSLSTCQQVRSRNHAELGKRDIHSIYCWVRNTINRK